MSVLSVFCAATILVAALAHAEDAGVCGPFSPYDPDSSTSEACRESGVQPSQGDTPAAGFDRLPLLIAGASSQLVVPGEALLALPKGVDGTISLSFELVPGAKIVDSYFSPVLCATIARITGPANVPATSLVAKLPAGATVVPHHRFLAAAVEVRDFEPSNDPYRKYQYALDQLGAERAWNVSRGEGVTVALLDSQPAAGHPDLAAVSLHEGYEEVPAATHGTLMAGVLAAASGNAIGIAGLAPAAKVLAVPVCGPADDGGADTCPLFEVLRGIDRAWEGKASVVNLSLVGLSNPLLERAVARLERLGLLVVAAVGNEGEATPRYPAAYPTVIGVGAVDRDGAIYARSNTGLAVELFAPGVEILSTRPPDRFAFGDGTSLAAAHVSGALAVLLGSGLEPSDARQRLRAATSAVADPRAAGAGRLGPLCDALAAAGRACAD